MNRGLAALLHAAYWILYVVLIGLVLAMLRTTHGAGRPAVDLLVAWPILVLAVVPAAAAFYAAYGPIFSRFLAHRLLARLAAAVGAGSLASSGLGLVLAYLLFGPNQPVFASTGEIAVLVVSLSVLAGIHMSIALVMRGFVDWYGDIRIREELTRRTHEVELELVRSRLDPHFLFNTLNNIDVLIARDPVAASEYLNKLSEIMRFVLYEAKDDTIALIDELSYIEKYVALERIRTRNAGYAAHEVVGDPAGLSIAPMTFIPFIENAFKHTEGMKSDGAIVSRIAIEGRRILFECANRCLPDTPAAREPGGLGHELSRRRLQLLYPQRHALETGRRGDTYVVRLTIQEAS